MVGKTISHYKVLEKIGEGGMGEVYRAHDTKLNRDVALKILPKQFASDAQRMGRFQREAEVLASLDHPNIGQIYGIEEAGQTKALVLQLIEGPTLAERIAQGPIPVEDALKIALQMAEGLEAAHEKGVIHRDLKPANIKITPEGQVKILDFGLAKALEGETPPDTNLSQSPTLTAAATQAGVILGTAAYMSPEQARGEATDKKADVWAFGCVLFEMLTGRATFGGKTVSDVLAGVLRIDPEWKSLPPNLHPRIRLLLERSLEKESKDRYQGIADARVDIQKALADPSGVLVQPTADVAQVQPQSKLPWVAALILAVITGVAGWNLKPTEPQPVAARFYHELLDGQVFTSTGRPLVAVSPDGSHLVYVANEQLYLRNLNDMAARPIQGTDEDPTNPFLSPDGGWVGYWSFSDSQLKKIATIGGASVTLCDATNPFGASWGSDDTIVYGQLEGIMRVSANGGTPELVVPTEAPEQVHGPQMLPGGEWVLFTLTSASGQTRWDQAQIVVQSLESGERKILWEGGSDARYVPTGHLIYALEGVLFALPFDLANLEISGGPVPIVEGVRRAFEPQGNTASANYGFSDRGTLIYVPGPISAGVEAEVSLGMIDRTGHIEGVELPPGGYSNPRVSSDGDRVVYMRLNGDDVDIVIYELMGTSAPRPLTFGGENSYPIWSADGEHVAFQSDREGDLGIFWQRADGTGGLERLTTPEEGVAHIPDAFSPDGETLSFTAVGNDESAVWMFTLQEQEATVFAAEPSALLGQSVFSPDGRWIAYQSNETGTFEIIVQPLPPTGTKYRVPNTGGDHHASWSPDGSELFYVPGQYQFVVVAVTLKPRLEFGNPLAIPRGGFLGGPSTTIRNYDIMPDGERFIAVFPSATIAGDQSGPTETADEQINIVLNWFEELKERVPVP